MFYVATLPFMSKKVIELIDETKAIDQLVEDSYGSEISFTPQRFYFIPDCIQRFHG